nr:hypothetical protein [Tanacetum cinerariifolium]
GRVGEEMRILLQPLIFTFPSELRISTRVLTHLHNWDMALFQTFDLTVHDFDMFFNKVELAIDLDFIQRYSKSFIGKEFL